MIHFYDEGDKSECMCCPEWTLLYYKKLISEEKASYRDTRQEFRLLDIFRPYC
jgi:hypothetical protein